MKNKLIQIKNNFLFVLLSIIFINGIMTLYYFLMGDLH
jgi:hypothetical protein